MSRAGRHSKYPSWIIHQSQLNCHRAHQSTMRLWTWQTFWVTHLPWRWKRCQLRLASENKHREAGLFRTIYKHRGGGIFKEFTKTSLQTSVTIFHLQTLKVQLTEAFYLLHTTQIGRMSLFSSPVVFVITVCPHSEWPIYITKDFYYQRQHFWCYSSIRLDTFLYRNDRVNPHLGLFRKLLCFTSILRLVLVASPTIPISTISSSPS